MEPELSKQLIESARERYDRTAKWSSLVITLIALFHIVVFGRYVELQKDTARSRRDQADLGNRVETLGLLATSLETMKSSIEDGIFNRTQVVLDEIKADFVQFNLALTRAVQSANASIEDGDGAHSAERPMAAMTAQQAPDGAREAPRWELSDELVRASRSADKATFDRLLPVAVEPQIIAPRFAELNATWSSVVAPTVAASSAKAQTLVRALIESDREHADQWRAVLETIRDAADNAATFTFSPPADHSWYRSVIDKGSTFVEIQVETSTKFHGALAASSNLQPMSQAAADALAVENTRLAELTMRQQELIEAYKSQSEVLAGLGEPFKFVAADISFVAPRFPALLGIVLAACAILTARALSSLLRAAAEIDGPQSAAKLLSLLRTTPPTSPIVIVGRVVLSAAWIVLAAWSLREWPGKEAADIPLYLVFALVSVLVGEVYRAWILRAALPAASA